MSYLFGDKIRPSFMTIWPSLSSHPLYSTSITGESGLYPFRKRTRLYFRFKSRTIIQCVRRRYSCFFSPDFTLSNHFLIRVSSNVAEPAGAAKVACASSLAMRCLNSFVGSVIGILSFPASPFADLGVRRNVVGVCASDHDMNLALLKSSTCRYSLSERVVEVEVVGEAKQHIP